MTGGPARGDPRTDQARAMPNRAQGASESVPESPDASSASAAVLPMKARLAPARSRR